MLAKILIFLQRTRMTVLSGIFLAGSLVILLCDYHTAWNPALFTLVISGLPLVVEAVADVRRKRITSALLVSIAMIACVFLREYFAAGEVAFIMQLGELLERFTVKRARRGLRRLMELAPEYCSCINDGHEVLVAVEAVAPGDMLRIRPGDIVPVDGTIQRGHTAVDESSLTGEALPVEKAPGDTVASGTLNGDGMIEIHADKKGEDSSLQQLIRLVREAEANKAPAERIVDKISTWLVPAALLLAIAVGIVTHDMVKAVTILVVFCPCALVLATPTAIAAAIGQAAKRGVIIKSGAALEAMGRANRVALDKTGTLTYGKPMVSKLIPLDGLDEETLLQIAASAESGSNHPLGRAIWNAANMRNLILKEPNEFRAYRGRGLRAMLNDFEVFCGSEDFFRELEIPIDADADAMLLQLRSSGATAILVAGDGRLCGIIGLADTVRPDAPTAIRRLAKFGAHPVLLTGDHLRTAEHVAAELGIGEIGAELLPADKAGVIMDMQKEGRTVCMVGDGVNDAPALKTADVGVAMGVLGSDVAVETADVVLMTEELTKLVYLKKLANITRSVIILNITLSMSINLAAIVLSVLGWVGPVSGALIHNLGALAVVGNAAFLYDRKIGE